MLEKVVLQWIGHFLASPIRTASPRLNCSPLMGMCGCRQTHDFPRFLSGHWRTCLPHL